MSPRRCRCLHLIHPQLIRLRLIHRRSIRRQPIRYHPILRPIRLRCPVRLRLIHSAFVGGAFGVGLRPQFEAVLAVLAARALRRSVRVVLTRPQMYALGYRPAMIQRIALGANTGATLDAITHDAVTVTPQYEDYNRQETGWSGVLYTCANAKYAHKLAKLDLPTSCDMRCPSAARRQTALCST
jgi:xanthine dehydrogenase YagR molybdenum-binding subunit